MYSGYWIFEKYMICKYSLPLCELIFHFKSFVVFAVIFRSLIDREFI